ncbi:MAG: peptide chain release factor 2 [Clostridia bacterium]|nr:peptide chain release factor 2 [Clostridia bacterium]MDE5788947.1 peptide chain release factor 2 [Clostridia bacterium]MDE7400961.1 peptide chain release factor 2 [Clostridia bacterium]
MFKADDYRLRLKALSETLAEAKYALDIDNLDEKLAYFKAEQEKPEVWQDLEKSKTVGREISSIENKIAAYQKGKTAIEEALAFIDLIEEADDESLIPELDEMISVAENDIEDMRIRALLKGKYDANNAMLNLHSGAGGTEACDWTQMLYRMYQRYCEKVGFKVTELDLENGDEAGIKSVSFRVEGENAYGFLKAEKGVHRLVRISPFDSNKRRHTSFASLEVMPEVDDAGEVEIRDEDIRIDVYRSSGAGGQKVNKTETAIRITHFPTGIVVTCQNERSQLQNKEMAFQYLRAKLIERQIAEREAADAEIKGEIKKIEWGSQIRSYVFCPYTLAKDHRTGYENSNIQAVMDGDIQGFIIDYLKKTV